MNVLNRFICKLKNTFFSPESIRILFEEKKYNFKNEIAIVCIAKNESNYIKEWIDFHLMQGIGKIYIYDNESTDRMYNVIKQYIETEQVEYIYFPGKGRQLDAYNDALKKYKNLNRYMAFIDVDEFLMPENSSSNLITIISNLMKSNIKVGGIGVNWRMYGSSGYETKQDELVINTFKYRGNFNAKGNDCIKSIVNPRYVSEFAHVHYPKFKSGFNLVNEDGKIIESWQNIIKETKMIRINHYFTKSKQEWIERRKIGKADSISLSNQRTIEEFYEHDNNDIYDLKEIEIANKIGMI